MVDNRCTDNFPSTVESIPTLGSFTLGVRSLGKTRPNNIEKDRAIHHVKGGTVHRIVLMY